MDISVREKEKQNKIKHEVVAAYNEVLRNLKVMKGNLQDEKRQEEKIQVAEEEKRVIEIASIETPDDYIKNIAELKLLISKSLDEIKQKVLPEYQKFHTLRQAIHFSQKELHELHDIKVNAHTLTALITAQKEKKAVFEKEMMECRRAFEQEKAETEKNRQQEESEYALRRDSIRQIDQEQYSAAKLELERELTARRTNFEEEYELRESKLSAREREHQQVKERESWVIAREQEYQQLKEKAKRYPDELRNAVHKVQQSITEQYARKYEYDSKLAHIELESERKLYQQKIAALEEQLEQYKTLKQQYNQPVLNQNNVKDKKN